MSSAAATLPAVLLLSLVDDAAVFPPGNSPLDVAVEEHLRRAPTELGRFVGPLLVPAAATAAMLDLVAGRPLRTALIARPGSPTEPLLEGAALVRSSGAVELTGVEAGWSPQWRGLLDTEVVVTVEIPRDGFEAALDDVAAARNEGAPVQAKFRTGVTPTWAWPDEAELASFLHGCLERNLPFKLTGGLHHVVRAERGTPQAPDPQHGLLNVLLAVSEAQAGASVAATAAVLAERSTAPLAAALRALDEEGATAVRAAFTAYGCCTVTDPLGELDDLGLLPR